MLNVYAIFSHCVSNWQGIIYKGFQKNDEDPTFVETEVLKLSLILGLFFHYAK